jgi:hypothetical protein
MLFHVELMQQWEVQFVNARQSNANADLTSINFPVK